MPQLVCGRRANYGAPFNEMVAVTPEGRRITFRVLAVDRGTVRVGVEADAAVTVHRGEVQAERDAEGKSS